MSVYHAGLVATPGDWVLGACRHVARMSKFDAVARHPYNGAVTPGRVPGFCVRDGAHGAMAAERGRSIALHNETAIDVARLLKEPIS